jgi:hypothetical protein
MDMEEQERDDLTADEAKQVDETGETGEEVHRAGEFEELRSMMRQILDAIGEVREAIGGYVDAANAASVDNGAKFVDDEDAAAYVAGDVVVLDEPEDPRARDYTI